MEHTYFINCKKYTSNGHIGSKTINNKVKLLKNVLNVSMINWCFYNKFKGNIKTNV